MAAAEPVTDDPQPVKRRSSFSFLPPFMSELRVVLLGNSWPERSSVGNFILGETKFSTEEEAEGCLRVRGQLKKEEIVLINTPDLLHPSISEDKLRKHVETCLRLSDPGPHVFLVVLQPEDFTVEHKLRLCRVLELFGDQSFDQCLIQISTPREESLGFKDKDEADQPLKDMIRLCHYRYLNQKNLDHSELLTRLGQIAKENSGEHVSSGSLTMTPTSRHIIPALNLVLCGRTRAGKTSAAKAILGRTELHSVSNSPECVKHWGEVCGRWVTLVELPALNGKPQQEVMEQSLRCISFCDPEGVHAFIHVLPVGPLTDEDKGELETIQNTFGSQVNDFITILFTVESDPTAPDVVQFINKDTGIQEHRQSCGGRCFVLNIKDPQQIPELLDEVEIMGGDGSKCFTIKMFTKAPVGEVSKLKAELQDVKQSAREGYGEDQSREGLRMVLIGKNSNCKNATANTILGKKHFPQKQADKSSKKTTGEINGRPVTVINIPDLFDATGNIQQEITKFHSALSPGPHVFLLVLQIGNIKQEEKDSVELIKRYFGKDSGNFIIIIFTKGGELKDQSFESYIENSDFVKQLINDCGGRYQVFNNKDDTNRTQVRELLANIESMVKKNGGCYNTGIFDPTEGYTEIQAREKAEMKRKYDDLQRKHEEQLRTLRSKIKEEERKLIEKQLQEKDKIINKEREKRKKERVEEEKKLKKQKEREHKENATKKLEQFRKEMKRERDAWNKERKDLLEQKNMEKQRREEEKMSHRKLQEEYNYERKKWTYCLVVLLLILSFLSCYRFLN